MKKNLLFCIFLLFNSIVIYSQGTLSINTNNNITLPGGNYIVKDPLYDEGALTDIGIVRLYDGATNNLISTVKGSNAGDKAGNGGIVLLSNGDFLILTHINFTSCEEPCKDFYITFVKKALSQNIIITNNNSIKYLINESHEVAFFELNNGNLLIENNTFWLDPNTFNDSGNKTVLFTSINTNISLNNANVKTLLNQWYLDQYISIFQLINLSNNNVIIQYYANGLSLVTLNDGTNGNQLEAFTSSNSYLDYQNNPNFVPRCMEILQVLNENLFSFKFYTCYLWAPPIKLNVELNPYPIIEVYSNTNLGKPGAEPFIKCEPSGTNPITKNAFTAKVWLNEPTAFQDKNKYFVSRHFEITPIEATQNLTATIKLYFTQAEFNDYNIKSQSQLKLPTGPNDASGKANLQIVKCPGISNSNYGLPNSYPSDTLVINPDDTDIFWNGAMWEVGFNVKGFSGFFVSTELQMPLPLKVLSLNGNFDGNKVNLDWETSNETNTSYFEIQRSEDAKAFKKIGKIAANNIREKNKYQFHDKELGVISNKNLLYYRLKMVDLDDTFTYSKIIAIESPSSENISITPNPANSLVKINFVKRLNLLGTTCEIADINGRILDSFRLINADFNYNLSKYQTGIYFFLFENGEKIKIVKE